MTLINWLAALRNEAAIGHPPYNKLVLFTALTGKAWSTAHASPYASQVGVLELPKFRLDEIAQVFDQLNIEPNRYQVHEVHSLFHGHPYLTQLFAWSIRNGSTQEDATRAALSLEGPYESHWERMKSEIQFIIGENYSLDAVLAVVAEVISKQPYEPLSELANIAWRNYSRALRVFGLLDGRAREPTMCKFYRAAIEQQRR